MGGGDRGVQERACWCATGKLKALLSQPVFLVGITDKVNKKGGETGIVTCGKEAIHNIVESINEPKTNGQSGGRQRTPSSQDYPPNHTHEAPFSPVLFLKLV